MPQFCVECEDDMDFAIDYMVRLCESGPMESFPKTMVIVVPSEGFKQILAENLAERLNKSETVKNQDHTLTFDMVCPADFLKQHEDEEEDDDEGEMF